MNIFERVLFVFLIAGQCILAYQVNIIDSNAEREVRALKEDVALLSRGLIQLRSMIR